MMCRKSNRKRELSVEKSQWSRRCERMFVAVNPSVTLRHNVYCSAAATMSIHTATTPCAIGLAS